MSNTTGLAGHSPHVVEAKLFREFIERLIAHHEEHRPNVAYANDEAYRAPNGQMNGGRRQMRFITGRQWLEHETGRSYRSIYRLCYESKYIPDKTVEDILAKLGMPHLFDSETLPVIKNPLWTEERYRKYFAYRGLDIPSGFC